MTRHRVAALLVVTAGLLVSVVIIVQGAQVEDAPLLVAALVFIVVGALILSRTGSRIGWVTSATGLALLLAGVAGHLADSGMVMGEALGGALWFSWFALAGFLFLWFPTGEPLSPRWRWLGWVGYLAVGVALSYVVAEELCVLLSQGSCVEWVDNPIGIPGVPNPEYGNPGGELVLVGFVLIAAVSLVIRYLRSHGTERLQLKWFAFAVVGMITVTFAQELLGDVVPEVVSNLVGSLTVLALPVSIGVAVLRYRLYEIDRIVSRTVSYAVVAGVLAVVFFGVVTVLTSLLPAESDLAVAGSTLAVAALFNPVRRRVQAGVDRRFNRSRYDAQKVMDAFSGSLRDRVDPDGVVEGWVGAVSETMQPSTVAVWVREAGA